MALSSYLFQGDSKLEACATVDSAHVTRGASGDHVAKIQVALMDLDGVTIDAGEISAKQYGASTAAAVLAFKRKRDIVNHAYQSQADDIVGKMTIAALDREMVAKQEAPTLAHRTRCARGRTSTTTGWTRRT